MKYEYYNENTDIVDEELEGLKDDLRKKRDEIMKEADALNERGEELNKMEKRAELLGKDAYKFKERANQIRRARCIKIVIAITSVLVLGAIVGIIIWATSK